MRLSRKVSELALVKRTCDCRSDGWSGVEGGEEIPPPVPLNEILLMASCIPGIGTPLIDKRAHDLIP